MAAKKDRFGWDEESVAHMYYRYQWLVRSGRPMTWQNFDEFLLWCRGGYEPGKTLRRIDESKPYGPGNCEWVAMNVNEKYRKSLEAEWDAIVTPIRQRYQAQLAEIRSRKKEYFRYEHPDLEREGICFTSEI